MMGRTTLTITLVFATTTVPLLIQNTTRASERVSYESVSESLKEAQVRIYSLIKRKGLQNITAEDVLRSLDERTISVLKKYYFDNGCPVGRVESFERCVERVISELRVGLRLLGVSDEIFSSADEGNRRPVEFICPVDFRIKDEETCYREAARQYALLPVLALMRDKELKERGWLYAPRIFRKELPPTQRLAVEGIACGVTNGNLMNVAGFNTHFVNVAFGKSPPYDVRYWFGQDLVDTGAPGCDHAQRDCGFEQNIVTGQGEFFGLFQWLSDQLEEQIASSGVIALLQSLLIGQGTCSSMSGITMCLVVRDHTGTEGNQCYEDSNSNYQNQVINDGVIMYYNRAFVEVFPDPSAGYLTAIVVIWAEVDWNNIDPWNYAPAPFIPAHDTISGSRPTSEMCFEARSCADGWTFGHGDTQFRAYVDGVMLRARFQVVVRDSLVDVCSIDVELDILGSDVDHPVLGCLTDCTGAEPILENLGPALEGAIDGLLHGSCPIPGAGPNVTDADLSLCPRKPKGMPGTGPGGGNCGALLPPCPQMSGTWNCCWNYSTGSIECATGGGGGCRHALFPIDLNEFMITGRSFSVAQFCGRPTSAQDPPSGHAHEDMRNCYPGPVVVGNLNLPARPWYGVVGCFSGQYDIGCYTYPHRMLVTGTGCSISVDAGARARDLSRTCYPGFLTRGIALATDTSGFFPRPAFGIDNYSPYPFPDNALLTSRINSWTLTTINPTNWDDGYAQSGIGFTFNFYGAGYSDMCISTNGYITMPQGNTGECADPSPDPIPSTSPPDPYIAPLWGDLSGDGNEFLYYVVTLPPLFVPRTQQARQPGATWTGNTLPQVAIGWSGESSYYHLVAGTTEGNICTNLTDFNNYVYGYQIPFNFPFYDQANNNFICIDSNGWLAPRAGGCGGVGSAPSGVPIPNTAGPNGIIAALWKDLDPSHVQNRGDGDCDGRCPECEEGCRNPSCMTDNNTISWFCHDGQSINCGWYYNPAGAPNCGATRWCRNFDWTNSDICCGANGDCAGTCNANGVCSGTCYNVPGCVPSSGGDYDENCRIGPCDGDECGCNRRNEHCHGTCVVVCTYCDLRCHSTGGAGGCYVQNQCCFWRGGGQECACAPNQNCEGGCEADDSLLDEEPRQRRFRALGAGYVFLGSIDRDTNGSADVVDCPGADIANGVFDDDNDGNYYEDDDPAAANCQHIVVTWYRIPDFDAIRDSGCGNDDNNDCTDTSEDCCSHDQCSAGNCQWCGACNSDNRGYCRLRTAGILNPEPTYGGNGPCTNKNTFQVVLFSDGTIDINLENWTNTNILIDPDGPGGSGCSCPLPGSDCAPKTNPRPHYVGIENYAGTQGIGIQNPRPQTTYRFIRVGYASQVCGNATMQVGTFGNCPDTLNPSVNRTCRVVRWQNFHVKGQAVCMDMYALLYNAWTGISSGNYDIVFYMRRFWSPIPGVSDPAQQSQIARQTMFARIVGVENAAGTLGQYGFIPPDGTGLVMRYLDPFLYFVGAGISQDLLSDAAQMIYSSGLLCLAANPGGVLPADADRYTDITSFLPFNLSEVENLAYFFNAVRYICDPDSKAEIRLYPTGMSPASSRTGTAWPSLLTPPAPGGGTPIPAFPSQFAVQPFSDFTFLLPNYAVRFWCRQNSLGVGNPANFRKDGNPGGPAVMLFEGVGDWFLAADVEYFVQDPSTGWLTNPPFRVTQVIDLFLDVKPQVSNITWNAAVPVGGRIGGIADMLGDVLSGYLQGMLRTRVSFPLDVRAVLHPLIRQIRPEGPDVTVDEFPDATSWQLIESKYPWVTTMPDYLAIYVGCVDYNRDGVVDPVVECRDHSIHGTLDLMKLLEAFGGGFLAPVYFSGGVVERVEGRAISPPNFDVIVGDVRCGAGEECYLGYDYARRYFGGEEGSGVVVVYGGVKKISFRRNRTMWRVPILVGGFSGTERIETGVWPDGENELSFFVIDENDVGWDDIVRLRFRLDRLEPVVWLEGGRYDEVRGMRLFHSDRLQVVEFRCEDNMTVYGGLEVSYRVVGRDEGVWSEWRRLGREELRLSRGVYRLDVRCRDEAGNEGEYSELIYVKGDEVMGCPVIGSVTREDVGVAMRVINGLIPLSVVIIFAYIIRATRNGNGRNGIKRG